MRVALASDHGGFDLKQEILKLLGEIDVEFKDFGCYSQEAVDYPDYAVSVGEAVARGEWDRGILICGTGIGISIAANKVKGVRCALTHDVYSAKMTRQHNDSNVLAMGGRVIGSELAREIVRTWLGEDFVGAHHADRVEKISAYENKVD